MHLSIHPSISISVHRLVLGDGPNPNPHHTQHRFVLGDGVLPVEGMPRRPRQLVAHAWLGLGFIGLELGLELGLEWWGWPPALQPAVGRLHAALAALAALCVLLAALLAALGRVRVR